jgi:hypothetical protein
LNYRITRSLKNNSGENRHKRADVAATLTKLKRAFNTFYENMIASLSAFSPEVVLSRNKSQMRSLTKASLYCLLSKTVQS